MSLHGLGVIGAQVAVSIRSASTKSSDDKHPATPTINSPIRSIQSTPDLNHDGRLQEFDPSVGAKPYSPFYAHGSPTVSFEQLTLETKNANHNLSQLRDVENARPYSALRSDSPRRSKLWEEEKQPQPWMRSLSTRQRMGLKAAIAVVTVGSMIAVALGITAAVGGAPWRHSARTAVIE